MASQAAPRSSVAARPATHPPRGLKLFLSRYFYFSMTLLMALLSLWAFSNTVAVRLLHANPPRPLLLWFHAAAFAAWIPLFVVQSTLVRAHRVRVHRTLGWIGAALAAFMVVSGFIVANVMLRFEITVLHQQGVESFLAILWCDLIIFGVCMALAIYFRKRPEYHRRLVFLASCQLMQATFVRFHYLGYHNLFFPAVDLLILAGILRDLIVDARINRVYLYAVPSMLVLQIFSTYLQRVNPAWWQSATHAILGL